MSSQILNTVFVALFSVLPMSVIGQSNEWRPFRIELTVAGLEAGSRGTAVVEVHPEWAPNAVAHLKRLIEYKALDEARFYSVDKRVEAEFGHFTSGQDGTYAKDAGKASNHKGRLAFIPGDGGTPTSRIHLNLKNNEFLDNNGYVPFGEVIDGMSLLERLYAGYQRKAKPSTVKMTKEGLSYLKAEYPKMSYVEKVEIGAVPKDDRNALGASHFFLVAIVVLGPLLYFIKSYVLSNSGPQATEQTF